MKMFKNVDKNIELETKIEIFFSINTNTFLPRCLKAEIKDMLTVTSNLERIEIVELNNNKLIVKLHGKKIADINFFLDFKHVMVEVPVILYDIKNYLFRTLKTNIKDVLVAIQICDSVFVHLYGRCEMVDVARLEVYKIICDFLKIKYIEVEKRNITFIYESGLFPIYDNLVNTKKALLVLMHENESSIESFSLEKYKNQSYLLNDYSDKIYKEEYHFNFLSFKYCLYYFRNEIDDILSFNKCKLTFSENKKVILMGNNQLQFKSCLREICNIYFNVFYCEIVFEPPLVDNIFIFKTENKYILIGSYEKIIEILCLDKSISKISFCANKDYEEIFKNPKGQSKLQKILKETGVSIKTSVKDEWIEFEISGLSKKLIKTLYLLNQEKPMEINFFVQEKEHKKLIGYGGKNIQKYMKKHSVYIKFMNEPERISLGYTGNVIIKTPLRNANSLIKMKDEILGATSDKNEPNIIPIMDLYCLRCKNYKTLNDYIVLFNGNDTIQYYEPDYKGYGLNKILENNENVLLKISGSDKVFIKTWNRYDMKLVTIDDWIQPREETKKNVQEDFYVDDLSFTKENELFGKNIEELFQKYDLED
ncbi:KH domain containing protein [Tubulinosema ratisbonensis]|uniref:KH domain containing protein n=1 Tax=Tubulinosema ratisbonensis TaxID=291195 RepID=A0A437AK46_9MICR|nr:KH domain containing protein [Tubulinosema ratisbonensis]